MKKHFGILDFFFSYIVSGLILVIVFAVLLKVGATEESIGRFTEDHKSTLNFIQAYMAYRIAEWM